MHGGGIDQHVLNANIRKFVGHQAGRNVPPEPGGLQNVGLVDRAEPALAFSRQLRGDADDALDLAHAVDAKVTRRIVVSVLCAEVDTPGQLPDDHDIDVCQQFRLQRRRVLELGDDLNGPQVCEHAQFCPQSKETLLRAHPGVGIGPLWPADGAQKDGVAFAAVSDRVGRQGIAAGINRRAANQCFIHDEAVTAIRSNGFQYAASRSGHFRPDSVPGKQGNHGVHERFSSKASMAGSCWRR